MRIEAMPAINKNSEMIGRNGQTYKDLMEGLIMSDVDIDPDSFEGKAIQRAMLCFAQSCVDSQIRLSVKSRGEIDG